MSAETDAQCAVCAWREACTKKHTLKGSGPRCPDFTRDAALPAEREAAPAERHKQVVDVFKS